MRAVGEIYNDLHDRIATGELVAKDVARAAGIDPSQISRFLKSAGKKGLSAARLEALDVVLTASRAAPDPPTGVTGYGPLSAASVRFLGERLRDGKLALFVGAGLSRLAPHSAGRPRRLPLWSELGERVAAACGMDRDEAAGYRDVLDLFDGISLVGKDASRKRLNAAIKAALDDREFDLSDAHTALASLPWSTVITTNYDGLLRRALGEAPVVTEADYDQRRERTPAPRLFHIHGTLDDPHTLTQEDYRLWAERHPRAWLHLQNVLETNTLLFVGYSLSDPHIATLLALLRKWSPDNRKQIHAWMSRVAPAHMDLMRTRDGIEVTSLSRDGDFAVAFQQISNFAALVDALPSASLAPSATDTFEYDRDQYLRAITRLFGPADLAALYVRGVRYGKDDVALDDLYVEPSLSLETPRDLRSLPRDIASGASPSDADGSEPYTVTLTDQRRALREKRDEPRLQTQPAAAVIASQERLLIIGGPGSGKSTLLRHTLLRAAEAWRRSPDAAPFPVLIRLRELRSGLALGAWPFLGAARDAIAALGDIGKLAVTRWLRGRVLWLLDGIDEIRSESDRQVFREIVRALIDERPRDRFVLTTRPAGHMPGQLPLHAYTVAPMDNVQSLALLTKWKAVIDRLDQPWSTAPADVMAELSRKPSLNLLRRNPLLLTLIVLFLTSQRKLPRHRWEFYRAATTVLNERWLRHRQIDADASLPGAWMETVLERLALRGMVDNTVVFTRRAVAATVEEVLTEKRFTGGEIEQEIGRALRAAEELIGTFVAVGPDRFGFVHMTFLEYYAARAIAARRDREDLVRRWWDHPDWEEVWSLYALSLELDGERLEVLFSVILEGADPSIDGELCRPVLAILRLAGEGDIIVEGTTRPGSSALDRAIADARSILDTPTRPAFTALCAVLAAWNKRHPSSLQEALLSRLRDRETYVRIAAITALSGQVGASAMREALLLRLGDREARVRDAAAWALSSQANDAAVREALLSRLCNGNKDVRVAAITALSGQVADVAVLEALLSRLEDEDAYVRATAEQTLSRQANDAAVREALLSRLGSGNKDVRVAATTALSGQAGGAVVRSAMLSRLGDGDGDVRAAAAWALWGRADDATVREALLARLGDRNASVRVAAISALSGQADDVVVRSALLSRLGDEDEEVRAVAAWALPSQVNDVSVRSAPLSPLGDGDEDARSMSLEALSDETDPAGVRAAWLARLWVLEIEGPSSQAPLPDLVAQLRERAADARFAAVVALSRQAGDAVVREALLAQLADRNAEVRSASVTALAGQAGDAAVREALLARLADGSALVRSVSATALSGQAGDAVVREALLARLADRSALVRSASATALSGQPGDAAVWEALLARLGDNIEDVRHAAMEALTRLALRRKFGLVR